MGRFLPPDHDAGDANTIGGYRVVHGRPAAFEARDGSAYSVEIVADEVREPQGRYGAYLLFVRWRHGDPVAEGHLETGYLAFGDTADAAQAALGRMSLSDVRNTLDTLVDAASRPSRPWYDTMNDTPENP